MKRNRKIRELISYQNIFLLLVLLYWFWMFYTTQTATQINTFKSSETIVDVKIQFAYYRGTDKLYITTKNNCYMLNAGWRNKDNSNKLAKDILSGKQNFSITVWEHVPRGFFNIRGTDLFKVKQIVDLRNTDNIYFSVENHNRFQKRERISGIILGVNFSVLAVVMIKFDWLDFPIINFKKQSRKRKTKRKTQQSGRQGGDKGTVLPSPQRR